MAPLVALRRLVASLYLACSARGFDASSKLLSNAEAVCQDLNVTEAWGKRAVGQMHEYVSNANPKMSQIPVWVFPASLHESGQSRVIPFDLSVQLETSYPATAPNLMASFVRIVMGETLETSMDFATSETFYVIRGKGTSWTRAGEVHWEAGDLLALPFLGNLAPVCGDSAQCVKHLCLEAESHGGCAIYWVHDEPLMRYLGAAPSAASRRFEPTLFRGRDMLEQVSRILGVENATGKPKNRRGILLGNSATQQTKTLTPTLWSLLNVISANQAQRAHKHNSVALDLAVDGGDQAKVFTKMGRSLDSHGEIVDPISVEWKSGAVFVTPPGWWHSHHNLGTRDAWVLPVQDAGLYTHQRTLDIRFADEEAERLNGRIHLGATNSWEADPVIAGTMTVGAMAKL